MIQKAWFKDWFNSPYYHLLYQNRNDDEATAFINKLITHLNPATNSLMLDVACGKGRHSKVLADLGFDVTGIDLSTASIESAKEDEAQNLHFFTQDMRLPFRINYFDYAFNIFTSFGYFKTHREHNNAIRSITQSIKKNGTFVIDYLNVQYTADRLEKSFTKQINDIVFHITKWQDENYFFKQIQVCEKQNIHQKHLFTERVAKFTLGEFTDMLSFNNMQIQEVFGDYNLSNYEVKNSPRLIIVAKKM